jgi:hypothetical protein
MTEFSSVTINLVPDAPGTIAIPCGWFREPGRSPSLTPTEPATPATVVTTPEDEIFLIKELPLSDTYMSPEGLIAIAVGLENRAVAPIPSAFPG